jgi:hypothetical protein
LGVGHQPGKRAPWPVREQTGETRTLTDRTDTRRRRRRAGSFDERADGFNGELPNYSDRLRGGSVPTHHEPGRILGDGTPTEFESRASSRVRQGHHECRAGATRGSPQTSSGLVASGAVAVPGADSRHFALFRLIRVTGLPCCRWSVPRRCPFSVRPVRQCPYSSSWTLPGHGARSPVGPRNAKRRHTLVRRRAGAANRRARGPGALLP